MISYFGPMASADYHADFSHWSRSMLSVFRDRRRRAHAYYIDRDAQAPAKKVTPEMKLGSLVHASLLDPEERKLFLEIPENLLSADGGIRTNEAKAWVKGHEANGVAALKKDDFAKCEKMLEAAKKKLESWLQLPSRREHAIFWTNPETGIQCRCRPDWLIELDDSAIGFDLKTTGDADPNAFQYRCEEDTWLQRAHYREGIQLATGKPVEWYLVVVESEYPFACQLSRFGDRTCQIAETERLNTLRELEACIRLDDWSEPWEKQINEINLRPWVITKQPFNQ